MSIQSLTATQLRQAADLKEKIEGLNKQLAAILGAVDKPISTVITPPKKKGGMSAAGKARIAAAQKARWAKIKAAKSAVKAAKPVVIANPAKKARKVMSAAAKAKLSALAKARWAKVKATGKKKL
jgi:hypothetical protein